MNMIERHKEVARDILPSFLTDGMPWHSLDITYEHPHVERIWRQIDRTYWIFLHAVHAVPEGERPYYHSHPWPSSVHVHGSYVMQSGSGLPQGPPPPVTLTQVIQSNSYYEMIHPEGWHSVSPIGPEPVHSSMLVNMVSGNGWYRPSTAHLNLPPLSQSRINQLIPLFQCLYR